MGFYRRAVLPFLMDKTMDREEIRAEVERAGFRFERARDFHLAEGPRVATSCTLGVAVRRRAGVASGRRDMLRP